MYTQALLAVLYAASVSAHGKIAVVTGNLGGNGTSLNPWRFPAAHSARPIEAFVDEIATRKWSTAKSAIITTQVPGTDGNTAASSKRSLIMRTLAKMGIVGKRAENVNEDYPFAVEIPSGTSCTGTINGESGLCLVKISNNNANGPVGGVFAVQMSNSTTKVRVKRVTKFTS